MSVTTTNKQYDDNLDDWLKTRVAIKGKKELLVKYLRTPDKNDTERQKEYEDGAVYQNWTGRTQNALLGAAFRKPFEYSLPANLEYLIEDADEYGNSLDQFARSVVNNVLAIGRHGMMVDYPQAEKGLSKEQIRQLGLKPVFSEYGAETIETWRTEGGRLTMVKLAEIEEVEDDEFTITEEKRYRVLYMEDGVYNQKVLNDSGDIIFGPVQPTMANGSTWDFIPFVVPGSINNDINVDPIPMLPMAELNIAAFRNSADYEEGVYLCGQPMLHIDTGTMNGADWEELNPNGVLFGSRRGLTTSGGGSAQLVQAVANSAAFQALTNKAEQAVQIGARLIEQSSANQTAEATRINAASEHSVLGLIVGNCSDAIYKLLTWADMFVNTSPSKIEFSLNDDFFDESVDPAMIMAAIQLFDRNAIGREELQGIARGASIIDKDKDNDDVNEGVEQDSPTLGTVVPPVVAK